MYKLYLDSSGAILTVILVKDDQVLTSYSDTAFQKQTEMALKTINEILQKNWITLAEINEVIITNGPGSYTGVRVAITFVKTLAVLNPNIKVFIINSLLLQVGLKKAISVLSAYGEKSYFAAYDQGKEVVPPQLVSHDAKEGISRDLKGFVVIEDFKDVDIVSNFLVLHQKEQKAINIEQLEPLYIADSFK